MEFSREINVNRSLNVNRKRIITQTDWIVEATWVKHFGRAALVQNNSVVDVGELAKW